MKIQFHQFLDLKKITVVGDDKQIISSSKQENISSEKVQLDSLIEIAQNRYKTVSLSNIYNYYYEELINFSNFAFYDGRLNIAPYIQMIDDTKAPIEVINAKEGSCDDRVNKKEAAIIVDMLDKFLRERKNKNTIGIVTLSIEQKLLIQSMLRERFETDEEFKNLYEQEIEKVVNNEEKGIFIKSINEIQGTQRDIIIMSTVYSKNEIELELPSLESLSEVDGKNTINLAVSSAMKKMYVVTSIEQEDIVEVNSSNYTVNLFMKFLQYARSVSSFNKMEEKRILKSLIKKESNDCIIQTNNESNIKEYVYKELTNLGYEIHVDIGTSSYLIDLAIYDKEKCKYILGIEFDEEVYSRSNSVKESDIYRRRFLESRGWKIYRVWSINWWINPKTEIDNIVSLIDEK